jgi:hypothetical protein
VRRRLQGDRVRDLSRDLNRSPRWGNKWWRAYCHPPAPDFADPARAPHPSPRPLPVESEHALVAVRPVLEAGATPETREGLSGAPALWGTLRRLPVPPLPRVTTLPRVLAQDGLPHPRGANGETASYPWPGAGEINASQAPESLTNHWQGATGIHPFPPLALYPPAISRPPPLAKSRATATAPRLKTWTTRGRPFLPQFDNESTFGGGPTPARGLGLIGRWCRYGQRAPFCPPGYEATRPHQLEPFPSLWVASFWARQQFAAWAQVQAELPLLLRGYRTASPPPALAGRPPAPRRRGFHPPPAPRLAALDPRAALAADCRTASSSAPGRPAGNGDMAQRGLAAGQPLDGRIWASDHRYGSAAGELLGQTRGQDSVALSQAAPGSVAGKCP